MREIKIMITTPFSIPNKVKEFEKNHIIKNITYLPKENNILLIIEYKVRAAYKKKLEKQAEQERKNKLAMDYKW